MAQIITKHTAMGVRMSSEIFIFSGVTFKIPETIKRAIKIWKDVKPKPIFIVLLSSRVR